MNEEIYLVYRLYCPVRTKTSIIPADRNKTGNFLFSLTLNLLSSFSKGLRTTTGKGRRSRVVEARKSLAADTIEVKLVEAVAALVVVVVAGFGSQVLRRNRRPPPLTGRKTLRISSLSRGSDKRS